MVSDLVIWVAIPRYGLKRRYVLQKTHEAKLKFHSNDEPEPHLEPTKFSEIYHLQTDLHTHVKGLAKPAH